MNSSDAPSSNYLATAKERHRAWRIWEHLWGLANIFFGASSAALGTLVAFNTKLQFLPSNWALISAIMAPVLTAMLALLKPQAEQYAFRAAARELEKAINVYEGSSTPNNSILVEGINRGIDHLNQSG